jgi:hypothetical protein
MPINLGVSFWNHHRYREFANAEWLLGPHRIIWQHLGPDRASYVTTRFNPFYSIKRIISRNSSQWQRESWHLCRRFDWHSSRYCRHSIPSDSGNTISDSYTFQTKLDSRLSTLDVIPRKDIISLKNICADGQLSEVKTVLGWTLDTHNLLISLPDHKATDWELKLDQVGHPSQPMNSVILLFIQTSTNMPKEEFL